MCIRDSGQKCARVKRPVQANLQQPQFLALRGQRIHGLFGRFGSRAHHHNHPLGVRRAIIVKQVIGAARLHRKAVHHRLHNSRNRGVEGSTGFAGLEEYIGILRRAANHRPIRAQGVLPVSYTHLHTALTALVTGAPLDVSALTRFGA